MSQEYNIGTKSCTICRRWNASVLHKTAGLAVVKCNECGLYYVVVSPNLPYRGEDGQTTDELGQIYLRTIYGDLNSKWLKYYDQWIKELENYTDGRKLLDIGCGAGQAVRAAVNRGWDAYGIDTSSDDILYGQKLLLLDGRLNSTTLDQWRPSEKYDVITLFSVIEHVNDPCQLINEVHKRLKPGGMVLIKTPSQSSLITFFYWALLKFSAGKIDLQLYNREHIYRFSHKTLRILLEKCGFEIYKSTYDDPFWITSTRYLFGHQKGKFIRFITMKILHHLGFLLNRQNQLLVLACIKQGYLQ